MSYSDDNFQSASSDSDSDSNSSWDPGNETEMKLYLIDSIENSRTIDECIHNLGAFAAFLHSLKGEGWEINSPILGPWVSLSKDANEAT